MDLRDLEVFIAVAEELHFGRAAERVHLSQPSVTRIIKALETTLEVELLDRTGRQVELTPAGLAFVEHACVLCATAERGIQATRRAARGQVDPLVLGLSYALTPLSARQSIERFRQAHPEVGLELRRVATAEQLQALRERRCDVVLSPTPIEHPDLHHRQIGQESLVAVLPQAHPLAEHNTVQMETLMDHTMVSIRETAEPLLYREIEIESQRRGLALRSDRIGFWVEDIISILVLVAADLAVSAIPSSILLLHHEGVVYRPIVPEITVQIYAMWWAAPPRPALARLLAQLPKYEPGHEPEHKPTPDDPSGPTG
ncbi:MAG: LysR substrate-binding domain-containing protein [Myxococcota bacterium]